MQEKMYLIFLFCAKKYHDVLFDMAKSNKKGVVL